MVYIETNKTDDAIGYTHYMPFDPECGLKNEDGTLKTREQLEETGFVLDEIPQAEKIDGKRAFPHYNTEKGFWYEYEDIVVPDYPQVPQYWVDKIQDDMTLALVESGVL
jgi:hypothetical protein